MKDQKHIIWSNRNLDIEDWRGAYADFVESNDYDSDPYDESNIYNYMIATNAEYLLDERANLNKPIEGRILVIADLGLWNGRASGYRIINTKNLNAFLQVNYDYAEFYGDGKEIRGTEIHHDGANCYLYRMIREDRDIDKLCNAIYNHEKISPQKLNYYTKSLYKEVADVYG